VNEKRVARVMAEVGIAGKCGRRNVRTTRRDPAAQPAPDLVERDFSAGRPDELWVGDVERHEALSNLAVMEGHRLVPVAAGAVKLRAA
jgi:putative transposase